MKFLNPLPKCKWWTLFFKNFIIDIFLNWFKNRFCPEFCVLEQVYALKTILCFEQHMRNQNLHFHRLFLLVKVLFDLYIKSKFLCKYKMVWYFEHQEMKQNSFRFFTIQQEYNLLKLQLEYDFQKKQLI